MFIFVEKATYTPPVYLRRQIIRSATFRSIEEVKQFDFECFINLSRLYIFMYEKM